MNRKEQSEIASLIWLQSGNVPLRLDLAFEAGAEWADMNPIQKAEIHDSLKQEHLEALYIKNQSLQARIENLRETLEIIKNKHGCFRRMPCAHCDISQALKTDDEIKNE